MNFCSIASGSSGNSYFICGGEDAVLIDIGISARRIEKALRDEIGFEPGDLSAIFITHEHSDHIGGLSVFVRRYEVPVFATRGTWKGIYEKVDDLPPELCNILPDEGTVSLQTLEMEWFPLSHDANEPVGYLCRRGEKKIGLATDTGVLTPEAKASLYNCDMIVLEANHDEYLLSSGGYPSFLKRRISGSEGHLSNRAAAEALLDILGPNTRRVALTHLSGDNNYPHLALRTVRDLLEEYGRAENLHLETVPRTLIGKKCAV